jgi:hypothetical protein
MTHPLIEVMDMFGRDAEPIRWWHFAAPVGCLAFVIFCVGFTLWSLIA